MEPASAGLPRPLDVPTADPAPWSGISLWRHTMRVAMVRHRLTRQRMGLDRRTTQEMARALAGLPTDLLLAGDVATRDIALDLLRTAPRSVPGLHWRLNAEQAQALRDAVDLGEACLFTGPASNRQPRSPAEMAALRTLIRWAREGGDAGPRAAFAAALRAPSWHGPFPTVRWHETAARVGEPGSLGLPPRDVIHTLTAQMPASLRWRTHSLWIDEPYRFADSIAAFVDITLELLQLPSAQACLRLPGGITGLDVTQLSRSLDWRELMPLRACLPDLREITSLQDQLPGNEPEPGELFPEEPVAIEIFEQLLRQQIMAVGGDSGDRLQREHFPRLERILVAAREHPGLCDGFLAALRRETGRCLDANLMRLDEIEALVDAGDTLRDLAGSATHFFRRALAVRAHQTAAVRDRANGENLEIGHGLAWVVDQRLVEVLGLRSAAAEPVYRRHARLPDAVDEGEPVNDTHAADALIAAEIREGFPTLAYFAAGFHTLSDSVIEALEEDEVFRERQAAIDQTFQDDHAAAFVLAPGDPEVGTAAFLKKEAALVRARVDRLAHHLQPALALLRAAGVGIDLGIGTPP